MMRDDLYRACLAQLQLLLAAKERSPATPPLGPDAPNYAMMMRIKR